MMLFVSAPLFRLVGSHNDRAPLSLCYFSTLADNCGIENGVYNCDFTGANSYWKWESLMDRFDMFKNSMDGFNPIFDELAEIIMGYKPEEVVISSGDMFLSYVCLGNPYSGQLIAQALRRAGCKNLYMFGQYATMYPEKWANDFDGVVVGEPSMFAIAEIRSHKKGIIKSTEMENNIIPSFLKLHPYGQKRDVVMSSFGCPFRCSFCFVGRTVQRYREIPTDVVVRDIYSRPYEKLYFGDPTFTISADKVKRIAEALEEKRKGDYRKRHRFICESRVDTISEEMCYHLKNLGVEGVKIGVESINQGQLDKINKKTDRIKIDNAIDLLKKFGLKVIVYVLIGGPGSTNETCQETYDWLKSIDPDWVVTSVWADDSVDCKYDTHFSKDCLSKWGIDLKWFGLFNGLRKDSSISKVSNLIG